MESILKFENVFFSYDDEAQDSPEKVNNMAVKGVDLVVNKGDFIAILGHNGSGKSTLAKLSNAILIPDSGKVLVNGMDTADDSKTMEIRQHIGMVFQNPDNQIVATIVEEDVAFGPENLGVPPKEIRKRVDDALIAVDMYDYRLHEPHKLSGGQKQRIAIAGIIAMQPECIVLDESTAMLDPKSRREVMNTVKKLHDELGVAVVYITHFMDEATMADRVIVMEQGKIILDGTPREVFKNVEKLRSVGLDVPQATEFSMKLKDLGLNMPEDILNTYECISALSKALGDNESTSN